MQESGLWNAHELFLARVRGASAALQRTPSYRSAVGVGRRVLSFNWGGRSALKARLGLPDRRPRKGSDWTRTQVVAPGRVAAPPGFRGLAIDTTFGDVVDAVVADEENDGGEGGGSGGSTHDRRQPQLGGFGDFIIQPLPDLTPEKSIAALNGWLVPPRPNASPFKRLPPHPCMRERERDVDTGRPPRALGERPVPPVAAPVPRQMRLVSASITPAGFDTCAPL